MKIYIMRHGETYWNAKGLIQGSADIELTEYGIELAQKTRDGFVHDDIHFDRIFTSPLKRAVKTAEIINESQHAEIIQDSRIQEMNFGVYEGLHIDTAADQDENVRNCFTVPSKYIPKGEGETFQEVYDRVLDFFETEIFPLEGTCECVLIVCHGAVTRVALTYYKNMELDEFWTIRQPNCSVNLLELKDGQMSVLKENMLYYHQTKNISKRGIL